MGVSVSDGVLLGIVSKSKQIANHQEILREALNSTLQKSIVKDNEAKAVCLPNDPYSPSSDYYVGIFWAWSERRALALDDKWLPLFQEKPDAREMIQDPKYQGLQTQIFALLKGYIPDLQTEVVTFYEVRYYS